MVCGDLLGEPLLDLQAARERVHDARDLAEADDAFLWQIRDVHLAEKRQQVVLAHAEELDVLHHHHFVIRNAECRSIENIFRVLQIAAGEELKRFFEALGRFAQAFAIRDLRR